MDESQKGLDFVLVLCRAATHGAQMWLMRLTDWFK